MQAYGKRHYSPDYDRGCELRELPTGEQIHRYLDEARACGGIVWGMYCHSNHRTKD